MTSLVVLVVSIIAVVRRSDSSASSALALSNVMRLGAVLQWGVRQFVETEAFLASVERLGQYGDLPPEGGVQSLAASAPSGWIWKGAIEFDNVEVRYDDAKPVLKGVSFSLRPGEKLGIVGRTGAGKSSMINALFRLVELSRGCIRIDGVDISRLKLHDLRRAIAIIPQDPILFKVRIKKKENDKKWF